MPTGTRHGKDPRPTLSRTRQLVSALRSQLQAQDPMPPRPPIPPIQLPPVRVFPTPKNRSRWAAEAARHTTALLGVGQVGTRYATDLVLQFQAELAVAHDAVARELPDDWAEGRALHFLRTRVPDHRTFLLRPDLGRRLDPACAQAFAEVAIRDADIQPILADGLSARACMESGPKLLDAFIAACRARGLTVGTPVVAKYARVWLEDEIGQLSGAKVAAILLGERPGLGTGDGLSAYLVYGPKIGNTDGDRNMMSNIHARGTPPEDAAKRLAALAHAMIRQQISGVKLDLAPLALELGSFTDRGYRAPEIRERLVEV